MAKSGKLEEGKKPEEMTSDELEALITHPPKPEEKKAEDQKVENKEPDKKEEPKEKKEEPKEELILGKFKKQEDLVKAYQEAEKKISEQGNLTKKQREFLSQFYELDNEGNPIGIKPVVQQINQQQTGPLDEIRRNIPETQNLDDNSLNSIIAISAVIAKKSLEDYHRFQERELGPVREMVFERKVEKQKKDCREVHTDFGIFEQDVNAALEKLPQDIRSKDGSVESVYYMVKGQKTDELVQKAKSETQEQQDEIKRKADDAFVEGAGQTNVPTPPVNLKKMSSVELEEYIKQHPQYGKK